MLIRKGTTRITILIKDIAIKIPLFRPFSHGLLGMVHNIEENKWRQLNEPKLAKTYFVFPMGLFLIMERCKPLSNEQWENFSWHEFIDIENGILPVENKRDSFGINKSGRIVAIDYH